MSQRSAKLHRQVSQLRADVNALQASWLDQLHCDAAELEATAERARQAHRRAREAKAIAQTWRRNAILALVLAGLSAGVALAISAKAIEEPTTPTVDEPTVFDAGRLPGDDIPAQEPPEAPEEETLLNQAHVLEGVTVTHYDVCPKCCGNVTGITASGVRATPLYHRGRGPDPDPLGL